MASDDERAMVQQRRAAFAATPLTGGAAMVPSSMAEAVEIAQLMAKAGCAVRKHLREQPGACLAVTLQAGRWGMDPFAVANKTYHVNDQLAYEAQLVAAVVNTRAPLRGRIRYAYDGDGAGRRCIAEAVTIDGDACSYATPLIGQISPKNSPLWKSDPDQQLAYYAARGLARRHFPDVLLGVYSDDEVAPGDGSDARDITPPAAAGGKAVVSAGDLLDAPPTAEQAQAACEGDAVVEPDWDALEAKYAEREDALA